MKIAICDDEPKCLESVKGAAEKYIKLNENKKITFETFSHPEDLIEACEKNTGYEIDFVKTQSVRYAKSAIIDAVLSVYIHKAKQAGIDLKLGFAFPDKFEVSESELATSLANAIENAINACEKLPREERSIEIKVLSKPKFIIMIKTVLTEMLSLTKTVFR